MRVLHVQKSTGMGGSERYLLSLLPALSKRGVEVRMVVLGAGDADRFVDPLSKAGIDMKLLPAGPDVNPLASWRILREIRRFGPDLVHTHLIHADLYGQAAARVAGVPGVSTHHGTHPFYRREPYRLAARLAGRLAMRTIAVSHHVARFLTVTKIARPETTRVVYIGTDSSRWIADSSQRARARHDFGLTNEEVAVGVASRLVPMKGHDFLLEAFAATLSTVSEIRLLIAGDGPLHGDLEARARHLPDGVVRFLGYVEDIQSFMTACDVFVLPTLPGFGEGLSVATLEAMAAGRPVVATAVDSLPEIVVHDETGCLITPGDTAELAEALAKLASDEELRKRLGAGGKMRAVEAFSLDEMVESTVAVYREVAGG